MKGIYTIVMAKLYYENEL